MKVAFATQDMHNLDAHFAGARNFAIYEVTADSAHFVEAVRFDQASAEDGVHDDSGADRLAPRLAALDGCALLFVMAIGGPAAARVVSQRVHPVKVAKPEPISAILARLQTMLQGTPPPWLRKALRPAAPDVRSFADTEEDGR